MNTATRFLLLFLVSLLGATAANAQPAPIEPVRGKVLLLDNDRILEGDIEKVNGQYRIRRSVGELWVPADRSKRLCKDLDDCYEVMKRQVNLKDADERLRLARWCQLNGLKDHALHEAKIALDMRPDHAESLNTVQMLQRFAISSSPALSKLPPTQANPNRPQMAQRTTLDVSSEAFATFSTRVQPVLMNTCISCHSHGKGGNFQLIRVSDTGARTSAQTNLNAALEFINVEKSILSPFLIKSVVAHGGAAAAPLKGRQSAAFQTLQTWVDQMLEGNPHLKEIRQAEAPSATTSAKKDYFNDVVTPVSGIVASPVNDTKLLGDIVSQSLPRLDDKSKSPSSGLPPAASAPLVNAPLNAPPVAARPPMPRDPFDPAEFNSRPK